ncbi:lipopolysaccharide biosynthesis protein [Micromonospora maritima]|uniref:lipopolysaccharide biosynthesis protein n=1 Tax=Micromonospora maritima TaxID=986711 RepID=UPI00379E60BF
MPARAATVTGRHTRPHAPLGQAARNAASRILVVGLNAAAGIVTARALNPDGRGISALAIAVAGATVSLGFLSVEQAHVQLWKGRRDAVIANSVLLGPAVGAVAAIVGTAVVWLGAHFGVLDVHPGILLLALAAVPASVTGLYLSTALVLDARVSLVNRAMVWVGVLQCVVTFGMALTGSLTPGSVVAIWSGSAFAMLLVLLAGARPALRRRDPTLARQALALGVRLHPGSVALYLTYRLDVLVLGALATPTAVGLYALAVTVGELTRIPTEAVRGVFLPRQAEGDRAASADVTAVATRVSVALAAVCVGGLCLVAPVLIPLAYGHDFADSVHALYALGPGLFMVQAGRQIGAYLIKHDRPFVVSALPTVAVLANAGANLLLIPRWGLIGCGLSASLGFTLMTVGQAVRFCRTTGVRWHRLLPGPGDVVLVRRRLASRRPATAVAVPEHSPRQRSTAGTTATDGDLVATPADPDGRR